MIDEIQLEFNSVALRKESVDRNFGRDAPKSRQAVALRKESVDRNFDIRDPATTLPSVALRKESVDRNPGFGMEVDGVSYGRSPQGERG